MTLREEIAGLSSPRFTCDLSQRLQLMWVFDKSAKVKRAMTELLAAVDKRPREEVPTSAQRVAQITGSLTPREREVLAKRFPESPVKLAGWPIDKPVPQRGPLGDYLAVGLIAAVVFTRRRRRWWRSVSAAWRWRRARTRRASTRRFSIRSKRPTPISRQPFRLSCRS